MKAPLIPVFRLICLTTVVTAMSLAVRTHGATASFSTDPPMPAGIVISNLVGVYTNGTANDTLNSNVNDPRYVAFDQPVQGQTFTTGTNAFGYKLMSVSLKNVSYH